MPTVVNHTTAPIHVVSSTKYWHLSCRSIRIFQRELQVITVRCLKITYYRYPYKVMHLDKWPCVTVMKVYSRSL